MTRRHAVLCISLAAAGCGGPAGPLPAIDPLAADIASIHREMLAGRLSARELLSSCLGRIAGDAARTGQDLPPPLHAIVRLVPHATADAEAADAHLTRTGELIGPLHGIPLVVKDNIDVAGVPTSLGTAELALALPPGDAPVIAAIRAAGGIVVAKTNLAELARSSRSTESTIGGRTFNPYAPDHTIGGSSGGTVAAVAARFATAGLGTDTGASIRGPCAHGCLVGIRPTHGSLPMSGIAPLYVERDTVGPIARSVPDAAAILAVMAGRPELFEAATPRGVEQELAGTRLGVLAFLATPERSDAAVIEAFTAALRDLRACGATTVQIDHVLGDEDLEQIPVDGERFPRELDAFLQTRLPPHDTVRAAKLIADRPSRAGRNARAADPADALRRSRALYERLEQIVAVHRLHAFVHPTWSRAPLPLDAARTPNGDNSGFVAPPTGTPAITVPMGFADGRLPLGIEFVGLRGAEAELIRIASAYERRTQHHRAPPGY